MVVCMINLDYDIRSGVGIPKIGAIAIGAPHYTKHVTIEVKSID